MKKERRINRIDSRCSSVDRTLGLGPRSRTFEPCHLDRYREITNMNYKPLGRVKVASYSSTTKDDMLIIQG